MNTLFDDLKNTFRSSNNMLPQLILINILVFVFINLTLFIGKITGQSAVEYVIALIFYIPAPISDFVWRPWSLFTYAIAHEGLWHIFSNMLALYWFGSLVSEYLGSRRLLNLYILGGMAGGVAYLLVYNLIPYFTQRTPVLGMIGASASVYAIVVGAATLLPHYTFNLILIGSVRIVYIAAFYIVISLVSLRTGENLGGNIAHLGGAILGYVFVRQLQKGTDLGRPISWFINFINTLFAPKPKQFKANYTINKSAPTANNSNKPTNISEAELDAILDKINESGYESLSTLEKQKLFNNR